MFAPGTHVVVEPPEKKLLARLLRAGQMYVLHRAVHAVDAAFRVSGKAIEVAGVGEDVYRAYKASLASIQRHINSLRDPR